MKGLKIARDILDVLTERGYFMNIVIKEADGKLTEIEKVEFNPNFGDRVLLIPVCKNPDRPLLTHWAITRLLIDRNMV